MGLGIWERLEIPILPAGRPAGPGPGPGHGPGPSPVLEISRHPKQQGGQNIGAFSTSGRFQLRGTRKKTTRSGRAPSGAATVRGGRRPDDELFGRRAVRGDEQTPARTAGPDRRPWRKAFLFSNLMITILIEFGV